MNQMSSCMKTYETLTKKFLESTGEAKAAFHVRSQNLGKCEHLRETVSLRNKMLVLGYRLQRIEALAMSERRVPNYA